MTTTADFFKHTLRFKTASRTSRDTLTTHDAYIIRLRQGNRIGYGEAAPIRGLSMDNPEQIEFTLRETCAAITDGVPVDRLHLESFPALAFGIETAFRSLHADDPFRLFDTPVTRGSAIPINGLVWMGDCESMLTAAFEKVESGYTCIKFKVGAEDFDAECRMLEQLRKRYAAFKVTIRLDANGAFGADEVFAKLRDLSRFEVHSIEQPVKQGQWEWMAEVCAKSPVPVALDEELIGVDLQETGEKLIRLIKPAYLILKPTLLGGLAASDAWVGLARKHETGWWATSALESNIGLNAIAQWVSGYHPVLEQGLGTGQLYANNIPSNLRVEAGSLRIDSGASWEPRVIETD